MEFPFAINNLLTRRITKISNNLLPEDFKGDRRSAWDAASKITDILDGMGRASAKAQGLMKPITSAERLRNSEHTIYLLIDPEGKGGQGTVVGLLKMGRKKLFVFDETGAHHEMQPLCVLDFYVHESKQRMGCGRLLYEHMLKEENVTPVHLAIDRPSEKFLGFLYKYYGLKNILPQANNFVVFEGFFENHADLKQSKHRNLMNAGSSSSVTEPNRLVPGSRQEHKQQQNGWHPPSIGRYAAQRPMSSIGKILQNPGYQQPHENGVIFSPMFFDIGSKRNIYVKPHFTEYEDTVSGSTSYCSHHRYSAVIRDLKFSHSPLW